MPDAPSPSWPPPPTSGASGNPIVAPEPIVVASTAGPGQLAVALRQFLLAIGAAATALGLSHVGTDLGLAATIAGPTVALVTVIFGQLHERHSNAKAVTMAAALPNEIAQVKDSRILK